LKPGLKGGALVVVVERAKGHKYLRSWNKEIEKRKEGRQEERRKGRRLFVGSGRRISSQLECRDQQRQQFNQEEVHLFPLVYREKGGKELK
jgi:hypothetical protein